MCAEKGARCEDKFIFPHMLICSLIQKWAFMLADLSTIVWRRHTGKCVCVCNNASEINLRKTRSYKLFHPNKFYNPRFVRAFTESSTFFLLSHKNPLWSMWSTCKSIMITTIIISWGRNLFSIYKKPVSLWTTKYM